MLVDDEEQFLAAAAFLLKGEGITHTVTCADPRQVLPTLREQEFSLVLLDLTMPHIRGEELLEQVNNEFPGIPVTILTAVNEVETAVLCMKTGAFDYLVKPVRSDNLLAAVLRALRFREVDAENRRLKNSILADRLSHPDAFSEIVTRNPQMQQIFKYIEAVAGTFLPMLIVGETGVGKELLARAAHRLSGRSGDLVTVNAAGLDDTLFSDTLFGHKKGSFTGASDDRKGMVETAAGGTLFLDEIGDLSIASQVKLLRLLHEGQYFPLGSDSPKTTDARFIFATNIDLEAAVNDGSFRKDLFFRLRSHLVKVPPLKERPEDIPLLFNHFLDKAARQLNKKVPTFPPELLTLLPTYTFPGNVRELETMVFDAVARHQKGVLSMNSFKEIIGSGSLEKAPEVAAGKELDLLKTIFNGRFPALKEVEQLLISEALRLANNNQGIAASLLGISRNALNKRLTRKKGLSSE
jgi:DNA-binding NtrC family response regulator